MSILNKLIPNKETVCAVAKQLGMLILLIFTCVILLIGWLIKKLIRPISCNMACAMVIFTFVYAIQLIITGNCHKPLVATVGLYFMLCQFCGNYVQRIMHKFHEAYAKAC